jgi:hypothetical protein
VGRIDPADAQQVAALRPALQPDQVQRQPFLGGKAQFRATISGAASVNGT